MRVCVCVYTLLRLSRAGQNRETRSIYYCVTKNYNKMDYSYQGGRNQLEYKLNEGKTLFFLVSHWVLRAQACVSCIVNKQ